MKQFLVLKLIPMIFLSGALLGGCSDEPSCPDPTEQTIQIPPSELNKVPYIGEDILKFKNASGQTESYSGTGKISFMESEQISTADPACGANHTRHYHAYKMAFLSNTKRIDFKHSAKEDHGGCSIVFNEKQFSVLLFAVSNSFFTYYPYYDSLLINDHFYHKVSAIPNSGRDTLFMNGTEGILKLKSVNAALNLSIVK